MKLSPQLSLDSVEYACQGNAILGMKKSGKSYGATYIAERLMDEGIPFIAFDPIGIWHNLKIGKNGPGYPVVVAGGEHPDLPLTPESAPGIVRAAMKENVSLVVDLYSMQLSKKDWRTIVEQSIRLLLYENKPCGLRHIFIEEAAEFCPQRIQPEDGKVYAEIEKLARMGGNASLGYTLIGQRAEEVNKAVLELCDCLFLYRQKGRHSLTALGKWLDVADTNNAKEIIKSLPSLPKGSCWVWKEGSHEPQLVAMPEKKTFHPDRENPLIKPTGAPTDVSKFVARLNEALAGAPAPQLKGKKLPRIIDQTDWAKLVEERERTIRILQEQIDQQNAIIFEIKLLVGAERFQPIRKDSPGKPERPFLEVLDESTAPGEVRLSKCARAILTFLAAYDREFSKVQVGISAGYSPRTSTFSNALGELSGRNFIIRGKGLRANKAEMDAIVEAVGPIKKQKYSITTFMDKLSKCEREIYQVLLDWQHMLMEMAVFCNTKEELLFCTIIRCAWLQRDGRAIAG